MERSWAPCIRLHDFTPSPSPDSASTGSPALAAQLAAQFLHSDANHPPVLLVLAEACVELHRYEEARVAYERLEGLMGASVALCNTRGSLEESAGDLPQARYYFLQASALNPADCRPYIRLAALAALQGELVEALHWAQRPTTCPEGPRDEAWLNQGLILRSMGRFREAQESLDAALGLSPDYSEARRARADVIAAANVTRDG